MRKLQSWQLHHLLTSMDVFGRALPTFNLKGRHTVHTMTGGILTCLIGAVIIIYAGIKLNHLFERVNPQISQFTELSVYD